MNCQNNAVLLTKVLRRRRRRFHRSDSNGLRILGNSHGIIHIDYLGKGNTITGANYSILLDLFCDDLKKERFHLAKRKIIYHQYNVAAKMHVLRYKLQPHPLNALDLVRCDIHPMIKKRQSHRRNRVLLCRPSEIRNGWGMG